MENFNHYFLVPEFSNPNDIPDYNLLELVIIWLVKYAGEEKYIFTAAEVEETAKGIFGPDLRDIEHQELGFVWWDADRQEYEIIPLGLGIWVKTYIIDAEISGDQFIIDAVHLKVLCSYDDETQEVNDENDRLLGHYTDDELEDLDQATLLNLPRRRHIFTVLADGSFYLAQSLEIR